MTAHLGGGVHLNPAQAKLLPPAIHAEFLQAFAQALHGVFLWGVALAVIPFVLSWLLKEVPLRTTMSRTPEPGPRPRQSRSRRDRSAELDPNRGDDGPQLLRP